jgi:thiol-disulfide isomerase/thioredoxin
MKLVPTYKFFTVLTGLATVMMSMNALSLVAQAGARFAPKQLIAQANTSDLAKELQGKPVIVDVYASWCPGCTNIAPTLSQLKQKYGNKANFIVFDVTDRQTTKASMQMAAKLGLSQFFEANKSQTSAVAIIDPSTGKVIKQFRNNADLNAYSSILDRSIAQMGNGGAMKKGDAMSSGDAMKKP